jgi:hypothetical protein
LWPETLLEENFKTVWITRFNLIYHSFIFNFIECTRRIKNFSTGLQSPESSIEELGLESGYGVDILEVPVFHGLGFLEPDSFPRAGCIDEDTVESLWEITIEPSIVVRNHNAIVSESFGIRYKLCHTIPSRLIGNDDGVGEMFTELGGFSSWTGCHIEDEERGIFSFSHFFPHPQPLSSHFFPHPQPLSFGGEGGNDGIIKVLESFLKII